MRPVAAHDGSSARVGDDGPVTEHDRSTVRTERGFDRFVDFSDAVVAIAITLLILPVVDAVSDSVGDQRSAADFFQANGDRILAFALSSS
jgi:uncharacterized membrane protein